MKTLLATLVACLVCSPVAAGECQGDGDCFRFPPPCSDGHCRAGCPEEISCFARPSILPQECGYYVGGGARCSKGEPRCCDEGTWGWDYFGLVIKKKVALNWWHGARYQGGSGAYKTDGPRILCGH